MNIYPDNNGGYRRDGQQNGNVAGWEFVNGQWQPAARYGGGYGAPGGGTPRGSQPKKSRAPRVVALVLACALSGFGGGALAYNLMDAEPKSTVVYQAPEGTLPSAEPAGSTLSISDVAAKAGQSVVSITTENLVADFTQGGRVVSGAGSGVIISEDGIIITNNHVVEDAQSISVTLPDGSDHQARVLGTDPATDIAVIKIDVTGLVPVVVGNSDELRVGEFCLAIGNPMGTLGGTVTDGIISATDRRVTIDNFTMTLLQMNAAVSPGNSGGGLFDARGALIGIVNAKKDGDGAEGLGFAIPVNTAMEVAQQIIENGHVTGRPGLNVTILTVNTEAEASAVGVSGPGIYLSRVEAGGAADKAGLRVGDRIVSVAGTLIEANPDALSEELNRHSVGDTVEIVVERDGQQRTMQVILGELVYS